MKTPSAASLFTALLFASSGGAAIGQTAQFKECMYKADGLAFLHNTARLECIAAEMKIQDRTLNAVYKQALSKMDAEEKGKLVPAQRAWILYRDADCKFEDLVSPVSGPLCLLTKTTTRARDIGDISELLLQKQ
jgi:uncharacterized protein YecT (DUF1311 family)